MLLLFGALQPESESSGYDHSTVPLCTVGNDHISAVDVDDASLVPFKTGVDVGSEFWVH